MSSFSSPPTRSLLDLGCASALAGIGATVAAGLLWAQFRGFDLLDGGCYFLIYQDPADNPDTHTRFYLFARPVWWLCRQDITTFRVVCLLLMSLAAYVF